MLGRMRPVVLLALAVLLTASSNEPGSDPTWAMRSRVWCDTPAGYAFRYPYDWRMPGMYDGVLNRKGSAHGTIPYEKKDFKVQGRTVSASTPKRAPRKDDLEYDVNTFSLADPGGELDLAGNTQAKISLEWKDFDYYRNDPARPHADPKNGAPSGVVARIGTAADRCALVMRYNGRVSGVVCAGSADDAATKALFDSFELLPGPPEKGKKAVTGTWRERQARAGKVFAANGSLIAATVKSKPVDWTEGWDIETEHYHISAHTSPGRLMQHAAYYEALYRSYCAVYQPEQMPPVKFEVHVFDKNKDFLTASNSWGIPVSSGPGGIVGGFFVPSLLSLWVFEESGVLGGEDFSVEHVSAHECSHQFLHVACNGSDHVPTWINEGLAVYFESSKFKNGTLVLNPPTERLGRLKMFYGQDNSMLQKPEKYLEHKGGIGADQYGEVYAMVHFWVFNQCRKAACKHTEKDNCGRYRFLQFWAAMRKGEEGGEAFERIFMADMIKTLGSREKAVKAWEKEMVEYVKKNNKWKVD